MEDIMALNPTNERHKKQITAGTAGRNKGHKFEALLTAEINKLKGTVFTPQKNSSHLLVGNPAKNLLQYISNHQNITILSVHASWLGGLATSGLGDAVTDSNGAPITKSKSDILLKIVTPDHTRTTGISVKTCNKKTPTNAQMFFTTARAFCQLLSKNHIPISNIAENGLSMFCGDIGYRPLDIMPQKELSLRISDPNRYYWEETPLQSQKEWKHIFSSFQNDISLLLFQKAYKEDPYPPEYLLHQTVKYDNFTNCEAAIFSMNEIVVLSRMYSNYTEVEYVIRKGSYKNDNNIHLAPRFGFIQFQRGGQKQHPTQLQFNLKAGYFYHIGDYFDRS